MVAIALAKKHRATGRPDDTTTGSAWAGAAVRASETDATAAASEATKGMTQRDLP
jgi:hypothetical protein